MAYISDQKYKVTAVNATTATLQPESPGFASANQLPTQIVLTWAVRPVEIVTGTILIGVRLRTM